MTMNLTVLTVLLAAKLTLLGTASVTLVAPL